jgi:hypothetical protein
VRPKSTVRIPENGAQQPASIAVFQATNGCAAHSSHRLLTLGAETCSLLAKITSYDVNHGIKILLANCKTEHDSELQLLASKLDFLIRQQYH